MSFEGTEWYWCPACTNIYLEDAQELPASVDDLIQTIECDRCGHEMRWVGLVEETNGPPFEMNFWFEETERPTRESCPTCGQDRQTSAPKYMPHFLPKYSCWLSDDGDPMGFIPGETKIYGDEV